MERTNQIGRMDRLIRIERPTVTQESDFGTDTVVWVTHAMAWAEVQDVLPSRAEANLGDIRIANRPTRIRMRWRDDITTDMRIVLPDEGNRTLKIIAGPAMLGRRDRLEVMAESYTSTGAAS